MDTLARTDLTALVREQLDDPSAEIAEQRVERLPAEFAFSTIALHRVHGTAADGRSWSFFVKSIGALRHSAVFPSLPAEIREDVTAGYPWRVDADTYLADEPLPPGLRLPRLYRLEELGDERAIIWMEDVAEAPGAWDAARYAEAARRLGALAALRPAPAGNTGLRYFCERVAPFGLHRMLLDAELWKHPLLAPHVDEDFHTGVREVIARTPALLEAMDRLPHSRVHGDASPQNLLVPADGSASFVAIDWSWGSPGAAGFDLGQLLAGHAHSGLLPVEELPAMTETVLAAYGETCPADPDAIRLGALGGLVLRSLPTAVPMFRLDEPPAEELADHVAMRVALARHLVGVGLALAG
ncbi:phosphotransferase family protein [Actinocorallia longicatena]|uniref:Aminoglycoside phosphotransferase domain-containing protein n=1 Tax=Actinocorallia longicatena TaxID=111803 RepID=A0ABP6QEA2_9ACTN